MSEEAELQKKCNKLLKDNGIGFIHIEKGRGKNKTHRGGFPDILFWIGRKFYAVELKAPGKKATPEQLEYLKDLTDNGGAYTYVLKEYVHFESVVKMAMEDA